MSTQRVTDTGSTPARLSTVRGIGLAMGLAGVALTGWGMLGGIHSHAATPQIPVLFTDPGCTPSAAGPGVVTVCLHESQEGTTASAFADHSCDNIDNRNSLLDYFVFVLPAAGDSGRTFTSPAPTVYFDTGSTSGTIGSNAKFFYASALPGTTLLEAVAHADNGTGTPTGGEAQSFNLTHTCPASVTSSTTTTGTVSGTSTSQSSTATSTSSSTGTVSGTSTSQSSTGTVSGTSTSTSTSPSTTTETSTVTSTGTVSGTTTTTSTSPTTTTATTTVTSTGTVSGTSTSTVTSTVTSTSTVSGTSTTQSSSTGGVSGVSTTNTTSSATGGVQGITSPNTGADAGGSVLAGLLLMSGGATILGVGSRRSRTRR